MGFSENRDTNQVASVNFFVGEAESRSNTVCIARLDNEAYGKIYSKMIVKEVFRGSLMFIRETGCAYGKFFENKAVFISKEWFPDFANYRRNGYDFDARFDDGLAAYKDKELFELIDNNAPILSKELKEIGNYRKGGKKGFEAIVTRLQAQCYVIISNFVYQRDKRGKPYGWGIAEYSTPEKFMDKDFTERVYERTPEQSYQRIFNHLKELLPNTDESAIRKILK